MFDNQGTGKKKALTDPVEILPFKNQPVVEKSAPTVQPVLERNLPSVEERPEPRKITSPSQPLNTNNLSIQQLYVKEKMKTNQADDPNLPKNNFSVDQMKMAWKQFAYTQKQEHNNRVYLAMTRKEPTLKEDFTICIEIDSPMQEAALVKTQAELVLYLQEELKNHSIQLEIQLNAAYEKKESLNSPEEKFLALARKYPNLHVLRKNFNLDFDF